jgi:competence protein ComEA
MSALSKMLRRVLPGVLALGLSLTSWAAVEVNKATQAELETISGVGPAMSGRILAERQKAEFKDWSDLVGRVKGVGLKNASRFSQGGLTVNGAAYPVPAVVPRDKGAAGATAAATQSHPN